MEIYRKHEIKKRIRLFGFSWSLLYVVFTFLEPYSPDGTMLVAMFYV